MPRIPRGQLDGQVFHILNRGNGRAAVFHKDADYRAFIALLAAAKERIPVRISVFCLLPNHFHLVVEAAPQGSISAFMQWWLTSHVRRYHRHYGSSGHVWQGRFKSFPIQEDDHFLTVARYVLQNPVRARLVTAVADWPWSSLHYQHLVDQWPVTAPSGHAWLEQSLANADLEHLRTSVKRQTPFGDPLWQHATATLLGLESTLHPPGRPSKRGQAAFATFRAIKIQDLDVEK